MSQKHNSKWSESKSSEVKRLTKNFNAKINRLTKKNKELSQYLPKKVNAREILQSVDNANDLNVVMRSLSSFTKRGSEKITKNEFGETTTQWKVKEDKKLYNRTINRFNAKLDKVATIENIDYLPNKLNKSMEKEDIKTYSDFIHFIDRHQSFLQPEAEKIITSKRGAKSTKWEVDEFYKNQNEYNIQSADRLRDLQSKPLTLAGKETSDRPTMNTIKENEVKPSLKNYDNMSMEEFKRANRLMEKRMHSSYNDRLALNKLIHYCVGLESQGLGDVVEVMKKVPLNVFLEKLDTDDIADFDFIYDPQDLEVRREKLLELWLPLATNEGNHKIEYFGVDDNGNKVLLRL